MKTLNKKIAVILSGCGNKDGSEITEAVSLIINLSKLGAEVEYFAPNEDFTAMNFVTNHELDNKRNMMIEAARITRSKIKDLELLNADHFDGLALPGGYGVAKNLSSWATHGSKCQVNPLVAKAIKNFHQQSKPIAAICIAPVLVAKVLGAHKVTVTIGDDKETIQEILKTGAQHEVCPVDDYVTDRECKVITTPAYMYAAQPYQVFEGIAKLSKEFMEMA